MSQPRAAGHSLDPNLDLVVERLVPVPAEVAWRAWTEPAHLRQWFVPAPGVITECEIDLCPGGVFRFVSRQPDGAEQAIDCCYLEVMPHSRLVWTDALRPGYRPAPTSFFTAVMTLTPHGESTLCTTMAMHRSEEECRLHADLGFHDGWGTVLVQLAAYLSGNE